MVTFESAACHNLQSVTGGSSNLHSWRNAVLVDSDTAYALREARQENVALKKNDMRACERSS